MKQVLVLLVLFLSSELFTQSTFCPSTVTDIDGNVYDVVQIGNQCWIKENLRTTRYTDGSQINDFGADSLAWANDVWGSYAWYDNDSTMYGATYGALYNWYAVDNPSGLCPTGWHVPSDNEWKEMEGYLGMSQISQDSTGWRGTNEGNMLKDSSSWDGNNSSGFTALSGGHKISSFQHLGVLGYWWASSDTFAGISGHMRFLGSLNSKIYRSALYKYYGQSVRCILDSMIITGSNTINVFEDNAQMRIYPNPFTTSTTIELQSEPHILTIYDIVGNKVREEQVSGTILIERGDLTKGIYIIDVRSESKNYSGKLVVE